MAKTTDLEIRTIDEFGDMKTSKQAKTKLVPKWDCVLGRIGTEMVEVDVEVPTLKERWKQQQEEGTWMEFEGL